MQVPTAFFSSLHSAATRSVRAEQVRDPQYDGPFIPEHLLNMKQTWHRLLFMHWPVAANNLRRLLPPGLDLDTYEKTAWVGLIPFGLKNLQMRVLPQVPCCSPFAEVNVRTYVKHQEKPGIFFLSLDATNALARWIAKTFYKLPYVKAKTVMNIEGDETFVESRRPGQYGMAAGTFQVSYHPTSKTAQLNESGSLTHWLTERYRYYALGKRQTLYHCDITHPKWILQPAEAEIRQNDLAAADGVVLPSQKPLLHYVHAIDAEIGRVHKTI